MARSAFSFLFNIALFLIAPIIAAGRITLALFPIAFPRPDPVAFTGGRNWRSERDVRVSLRCRATAFMVRRVDRARGRQHSSGLNFGGVGAGLRLAG